jgi:hypothetical protein
MVAAALAAAALVTLTVLWLLKGPSVEEVGDAAWVAVGGDEPTLAELASGSAVYLLMGRDAVEVATDAAGLPLPVPAPRAEADPALRLTVATAFFYDPLGAKHPPWKYRGWIATFLQLRANVHLFTDARTYAWQLRPLLEAAGKLNLVVHLLARDEFYTARVLGIDWAAQHALDPEAHLHGLTAYASWDEKVELARLASVVNVFNASWFAWVDIGCFRGAYTDVFATFPSAARLVHGKVHVHLVSPVRAPVPLDDPTTGPPLLLPPPTYDYVAGTFFFADADALAAFHACFYRTLAAYWQRGLFVGKDQTMFNACVLLEPDLYVTTISPPGEDVWFYPQKLYS